MNKQTNREMIFLKFAFVILFTISIVTIPSDTVSAQGVNDAVCADCHDEVVEEFQISGHSMYMQATNYKEGYYCTACHGSAVDHIADGDVAGIINPKNTDQFGGTILCLQCHDKPEFDDWNFSIHASSDVSCASCHTVHGKKSDPLNAKTKNEMCYECHQDVQAATMMPSHHPVAEGKIDCVDCHGVHGGTGKMTDAKSGREMCISCHMEQEGPFVYEHDPVNEDCMICHTSHGSVADKLLKYTEPALCLNCHSMHFHASVEGIDGLFTPPQDSTRTSVSSQLAWKEGMLTKCTQCHTEIHGSDHPSQATSTSGNTLTR